MSASRKPHRGVSGHDECLLWAVHFLKDDHGSQLCRVRFLRIADLGERAASLGGRFNT